MLLVPDEELVCVVLLVEELVPLPLELFVPVEVDVVLVV